MRRERNTIAMNVAEHLWEAERTHDIAMANTARLLAVALDARLRLRAGANVGHAAVAALTTSIGQQFATRQSLLEAHDVFNDIKGIAVADTQDFGTGGEKAIGKIAERTATPLRRVA